MSVLGIVVALPAEARAMGFGRRARAAGGEPVRIETASGEVWLAVSGMGYEQARHASWRLLERNVDALMSAGCAAGLDDRLSPGDLILPLWLRDAGAVEDERGHALPVCAPWHAALSARLAGCITVHTAPLLRARAVLTTAGEKRTLSGTSGAVAADMESAAVAESARSRGLPFLCVRAIADGAGLAVPRAALAAVAQDGRLAPGRCLLELLRAPGDFAALASLGLGFARARRTLGLVAAATGREFCVRSI